jgi:hypothetical protein
MQKSFLLLISFFAFFCIKKATAQNFDGQIRYFSDIEDVYPRLDASFPIYKKLEIAAGYSKDALQMIDITGIYKFTEYLSFESGVGYHKQNNFHFIYGIIPNYESEKIQIEGYIRGYIDHVSLYASEFEFLRKWKKFDVGFIIDIEIGKKFERWKESSINEIEKEKLYIGGLIIGYHLNENFSVKFFSMFGKNYFEHQNFFSTKAGIGLVYSHKH